MAFEFTDSNFSETASEGLVLIAFWATWAPFNAQAIDELAADYKGRALVGKLDVDKYPEVAHRFNIRTVPLQIILFNGNMVNMIQIPEASNHLSIKQNLAYRLDSILANM